MLGTNGPFTFAVPISVGHACAVQVQSQPAGQTASNQRLHPDAAAV
jgi:hypothetical protein